MRIVSGREIINLRVSDGTALCEITDPAGVVAYREEVGARARSDVQRLVEGCAAIVVSLREQRALDASNAATEPARQQRWAGIRSWCTRHIRRWLTHATRA